MTSFELPLLLLFDRLRGQYGWPLGVDDYLLVLRAVRAGYGGESMESLQELCRTLWSKTPEDERVLRPLLQTYLAEVKMASVEVAPPESLIQPPSEATTLSPLPMEPSPKPISEPILRTEAESESLNESPQMVSAIQLNIGIELEVLSTRFRSFGEYYPVTRRQMKQSWRRLRRTIRQGRPEELDIEATVEKFSRDGILTDVVLVPRRINQAEVVLLVDYGGSMVPFHAVAQQLVETAQRGGRLKKTGTYYFHDFPAKFLYLDRFQLEALPVADVLAKLNERQAVLIISDAGAARGQVEEARITQTRNFISALQQAVRFSAWLNPMPTARWANSSANAIARFMPMFEMNAHGLGQAISTLRGQNVTNELL